MILLTSGNYITINYKKYSLFIINEIYTESILIHEHPIGDFTIFVTRKQSNEQRYYIYSA